MPTPSTGNAKGEIKIALPVKIENALTGKVKGLTIERSSITALPIVDRFNSGDVLIDVCASAFIKYETTGLGSSTADGKYRTMFHLDFAGFAGSGQYVFPGSVQCSEGEIKGERSDALFWTVVTSSSNSTGSVYIEVRYMVNNVDFGHGILFPQFK